MPRPTSLLRRGWKTVVVCASGPSFDEGQALSIVGSRAADRIRVIAVNDNWRRVPNADVLYACDQPWWKEHVDAVRAAGFLGELWTCAEPAARHLGIRHVRHVRRPGLTDTQNTVHGGGNSGYQAVNLAYLFGAERIALVGFDMMNGPAGEAHWFGNHPGKLQRSAPFASWIRNFDGLARGLEHHGVAVVNCSKRTALECFKRADLWETLAGWQ